MLRSSILFLLLSLFCKFTCTKILHSRNDVSMTECMTGIYFYAVGEYFLCGEAIAILAALWIHGINVTAFIFLLHINSQCMHVWRTEGCWDKIEIFQSQVSVFLKNSQSDTMIPFQAWICILNIEQWDRFAIIILWWPIHYQRIELSKSEFSPSVKEKVTLDMWVQATMKWNLYVISH